MAVKKQKTKTEPTEAEIVSETPPKEPAAEVFTKEYTGKSRSGGKIFWGMLLIVIGTMLVLENYFQINTWQNFWPILVILIGLSIMLESFTIKGDK